MPVSPEAAARIETVQRYLNDLEEETTSEGREPTLAIRMDRTGGIDLKAQRSPLPFRQVSTAEPPVARTEHRPPSPPPPPPPGRIGAIPVIPPQPPVPPAPSFGLPSSSWSLASPMVGPPSPPVMPPTPPPVPAPPMAVSPMAVSQMTVSPMAAPPMAAPPMAAPPMVAPGPVAPPIMTPAPVAPPIVAPPQPAGTIGQTFSMKQQSAPDSSPVIAEPATAPVPQRSQSARARAVELVWAAADAEERARGVPSLAEALGPAQSAEAGNKQRAVHRALARGAAVEDMELALWDSVDEDGVLEPPIVIAAGELELLFDPAEYAVTLVPLVRPFADADGELGERIEKMAGAAERTPEASGLVERELGELRKVWEEREIPLPIDELESEARRILITKRKFRMADIFQSAHVAALLRTEAHGIPVPVYLPAEARSRLPLDHKLNARLLLQLFPRQVAGEACPLAAAALAIARVVRS